MSFSLKPTFSRWAEKTDPNSSRDAAFLPSIDYVITVSVIFSIGFKSREKICMDMYRCREADA